MRVLLIAGHGRQPNASFDPGATGFIAKGEHRYMAQDLFPAMRKYLPSNAKAIFHTAYDVYGHRNLVSLTRQHRADAVVEFHFDATGSSQASGGHVIIASRYAPDKLDLRLRDAIRKNVGVRYNHKGYSGISGRDNLLNVNTASNNGINYRLVELGFGTNRKDANYLMNNVDTYAKDLVQAIFGSTKQTQKEKVKIVAKNPNPSSWAKSTWDWGVTHGLVTGRPRDAMVRQEGIAILHSYHTMNNGGKPSDWAKESWDWAKKQGYMNGEDPNANISRQEVATILKRFADKNNLN